MILLTAVAAGLILTVLRARLTGRRLRPIELKAPWLVFLAVIPQVLIFQIPAFGQYIPNTAVSIILVSSQALLVGFALVNMTQPGIWALGTGLAANFLAIITNGGWMPISPETVRHILPALPEDFPLTDRRLGLSKDWILSNSDMNLPWLSDRLTFPGWFSYQVAFSIGDLLIAIGAMLMLWSLSDPENRRQNELPTSG